MACSHMMNDSDNNILLLLFCLGMGFFCFSFISAVAATFDCVVSPNVLG